MKPRLLLVSVLLLVGIAAARPASAETNLYVSLNGSNQFKSVQDAINATPQSACATNPCIIHIKAGTYKELVYAQREKHFVHLVGDGAEKTVLTFNLGAKTPGADGKPISTHRTASTDIDADDFTAENLTFENTATGLGQAVALRVDGDRVVFRNCPVPRPARHDLSQPRPPVLRRVLHRGPCRFHFRRRDRFLRELPYPLSDERIHHRRVDAARTAVRVCLFELPGHRQVTRRQDLSGPALAPLFQRDVPEHRDVRRNPARGLEQLEGSRPRESRAVRRIQQHRPRRGPESACPVGPAIDGGRSQGHHRRESARRPRRLESGQVRKPEGKRSERSALL